MKYLSISKCEHGAWMVSVDDEGGGTRLTPIKCCGRWVESARIPMSAQQLRDAAIEMECNADQLDNEEESCDAQ